MVNARTRTVLIESAIAALHSEVKLGPEFVCTCCHRMMYRKSTDGLHFTAFHYICFKTSLLSKILITSLHFAHTFSQIKKSAVKYRPPNCNIMTGLTPCISVQMRQR